MLHLATPYGEIVLKGGSLIAVLAVIAVIIIGLYLLRSFGVYTLAKRQGLDKRFLAFLPFVWIYLMAKVTKINAFMGRRVKNFPLFATILFSISEFIAFAETFLVFFPMAGYLLSGGEAYYVIGSGYVDKDFVRYMLDGSFFIDPNVIINIPYVYSYKMALALDILGWVTLFVGIAAIFIEVSIYAGFAKLYQPMHSFAVVIFSIFGFFPIVVFALRNKPRIEVKRVNPAGGYNPYGTPFGNPYANPYNENQSAPKDPGDPFEEKGVSSSNDKPSSDPFEEFNDKN